MIEVPDQSVQWEQVSVQYNVPIRFESKCESVTESVSGNVNKPSVVFMSITDVK